MKYKKGFTLVELVIVIAVIAILSAVLLPTFAGILERARENTRMQQATSARDEFVSTYKNSISEIVGYVFQIENSYYKVNENGELTKTDISSNSSVTYVEADQIANSNVVVLKPQVVVANSDIFGNGYTWEELISNNFIKVENGVLTKGERVLELESITLDSTITQIEEKTFYHCENLKTVNFVEGLTTIGMYAFSSSGVESLQFPESLTTINSYAFDICLNLKSVYIPQATTSISNLTFRSLPKLETFVVDENNTVYDSRDNCNALIKTSTNTMYMASKDTIIPSTVTTINDYAFSSHNLTSVYIPASVTKIGSSAFKKSNYLESIVVEEGNTIYNSKNNCNAIIETSTKTIILGCKNTVIPNTVTTIGDSAFVNITDLTSITLPSSVTTIKGNAFKGTGLTSLELNSTITKIENYAFGSTNIETLTINGEIKSIANWAFSGSTKLKTAILKEGVKTVTNYMFYGCEFLEEIQLPSTITKIGNYAFQKSGIKSIEIPKSTTTISSSAFWECKQLTSLTVNSANTKYDSRNNCNGIVQKSNNTLILGLTITTLPSSITAIGSSAFSENLDLEKITIPSHIKEIGYYAFEDCTNLKEVVFEEGVQEITYRAFRNTGLTSIHIPASVTNLDGEAFSNCKLTSITVAEGNTKYFSNNCNAILCEDDGMGGFDDETGYKLLTACINTTIPSNVTTIGSYAFSGLDIKTLSIPNVTNIEQYAFSNSSLEEITLGSNLYYIGVDAFSYTKLKSIVIPANVSLDYGPLFTGCKELESVTLPQYMYTLESGFFTGCTALKSVVMYNNINTIYVDAFEGCTNLETVYYTGTQSQYEQIMFEDYGYGTNYLEKATIVYNYKP